MCIPYTSYFTDPSFFTQFKNVNYCIWFKSYNNLVTEENALLLDVSWKSDFWKKYYQCLINKMVRGYNLG